MPYIDETLMIDAASLAKRSVAVSRHRSMTASRLRSTTARSSSNVSCSSGPSSFVAALFTRMSSRPCCLLDVRDELLPVGRVGEVTGRPGRAVEVLRQRFQAVGPAGGEHDLGTGRRRAPVRSDRPVRPTHRSRAPRFRRGGTARPDRCGRSHPGSFAYRARLHP